MTANSDNAEEVPVKGLKKRAEFLALRNGATAHTKSFLMAARANPANDGAARVGFTVTRKMGGAVVRNRIKRRFRAAAAEVFPGHASADHDYVLIARRAAFDRKFPELLDDMKRALLRLSRAPK